MFPIPSLDSLQANLPAHGGLRAAELRELGLEPSDIVDFSVSCNPYGPCAEMARAIRSAPIDRYPDPAATEAREALASSLGLEASQLALGNGAAELLWTLARVLVKPSANVLVVEPTFGEFRRAARQSGGRIHEWRARDSDRFTVQLDAIARALCQCEAEVVYLCAPYTPTGASCSADAAVQLCRAHPSVFLIIDQSFLSLSEGFADASTRFPGNAGCVRSLTKDHAIAGTRVGYLIADPRVVACVESSRASWTTSAAAQAAVIAACRTGDFVARSRTLLLADRAQLAESLVGLGLQPVPSTTGFLLVRTGNAGALRQRLLGRHRVLVRDCRSFDLPDYIRLAARPRAERERLISALRQELRL